ncbi:MAG: hypothetical protein BGO70_17855 [Bacteroidetes bacterium 43-93]|nr:hypothetical protein [Bacteroidota bacterium]OJX01606.1 MAG: hypothetical protein BGO70_17855 [Bacteroidetes bacterium 43-93]
MKKIAPLAAALLLTFAFTSCKKDYTCTCKDGSGDGFTYKFTKVTKKNAKAACDTWNSTYQIDGGSCSL